jgi:hypothetical protein
MLDACSRAPSGASLRSAVDMPSGAADAADGMLPAARPVIIAAPAVRSRLRRSISAILHVSSVILVSSVCERCHVPVSRRPEAEQLD